MAEHYSTSQPPNYAPEVTGRLVTCKHCGDDKLCWYKSRKTGRWYLTDVKKDGRNVTRATPDAFRWFALARLPHRCPARGEA